MMGELKKMRTEKKMTQQQVADLVGISLRSYKSYENDEKKQGSLKYKYILEKLSEINPIDEEHGIMKAKPTSDVDLLISANVKGLKFYGLVEEIREALHKKVDVLEINQLKDNLELTQEILKDGIKIYG